jgi:hypothetical protein
MMTEVRIEERLRAIERKLLKIDTRIGEVLHRIESSKLELLASHRKSGARDALTRQVRVIIVSMVGASVTIFVIALAVSRYG